MGDWGNFFIAEAGASAALAGLIFVAVSINLNRIINYPRLVTRAFQSLALLVTILITASLMLVPGQSFTVVGIEILVVGVVIWLLNIYLDIRNFRQTDPQYRRAYSANILMGQLATLPYLIAGISILTTGEGGIYWLVPALIFSVLQAILDSWVLLIEINR